MASIALFKHLFLSLSLFYFCVPYFILFLKLFYYCSVTVVCIYLPPFPQPQSSPPPYLASTPLLGFVHESFIVVPENPFPFPTPQFSPPTSPLVTVRLFLISMSVVIFCLLACFVDQVPLIGEIIWYL